MFKWRRGQAACTQNERGDAVVRSSTDGLQVGEQICLMEEQSCGKEAYSSRKESDDTHKSKSITSNPM